MPVIFVLVTGAFSAARSGQTGPPADLVRWIREHAVPLKTVDPAADDADLMPLKEMIGDARIVGLGEASHGTSEFFTLKHRLVHFLATELGFTVFAIEANMPEAYRLNEYVLTGEGDPEKLLEGMYFWTWNTQEVLDMILWMRDYNASGAGVMQFTGFDMQTPFVAMQEVRAFVEAYDPAYLGPLDEAYGAVSRVYGGRRDRTPQKPAEYLASIEAWREGGGGRPRAPDNAPKGLHGRPRRGRLGAPERPPRGPGHAGRARGAFARPQHGGQRLLDRRAEPGCQSRLMGT